MSAPRQVDSAWDVANVYLRIQHTIAKLAVILRDSNKTADDPDPTVPSQLDSMEEAFKGTDGTVVLKVLKYFA